MNQGKRKQMSNKIKILHLEDEPSDAILISLALKKRGVERTPVVVDSKEKFLVALDEFDPDVVLADHSLPSFNSFEALELLEKREKQIPLILVTATMTDEFAVDIIRRGAKDYVLKDRLERLPSAIENVLKIRQLEIEREEFLLQLERNERRFRKLVEHSPGAVAILSSMGKPVYVSPSAKNVLGYSEEESLQLIIPEIIHEDHREVFFEKLGECLQNPGKPIFPPAVMIKHKINDWRWVESTATNLIHDPDIDGIVVDFRDVTERKLAEKALLESEEKYRTFFENSRDGILLTATDGRILAANTAACEMFQRTEKEMCEAGRSGLIDINDPRVGLALKERRKTGKVLLEINMIRKDGHIFPAALSSSVFKNAYGEELTSMIIRDNSEAKLAEEKLKTSEEKYRQLFQMSPLPNVIYDIETFSIVDVNKAALDHYGFTRKEFLQLTVLDFVPEEERAMLRKKIPQMIRTEGNLSHNHLISLKKNGERIRVEIYGYNLQYQKRKCRLIICIDVTEKTAVMEKLKEKTEKLGYVERLAKLGYWEVGLQENYFVWSDEVYSIWDRKKDEYQVNKETFENSIHPEDLNQFKEVQTKAIEEEKDLDYEHRIILPDGGIKWVHEKGKVVKDEEGKPLRFEGSVQDVTERKNFLEKLMQSEARQRAILHSQTNYLTRIDLEGHYTYCNEKFLKDFTWIFPAKRIIGEFSLLTVQEYHREKALELFEECKAHPNTIYQVELDKFQQDGTVKSTLWDFICLTDVHGQAVEVQGVGIDITERVKAEKALKESNRRYELVSKATSEAIYDWDCITGVVTWSEAYQTLFGYDELLPDVDSWAEKVHPEDAGIVEDLYANINGTAEKWTAEYRYRKSDGDYCYVIEKGSIVRDQTGKALRMVGAVQDITDRKVAMQKLMRSEARHRGLIQSQTNYVIRTDMEGKYSYSNDKFQEDFGWIYENGNIVGKDSMISIKEYHHQRVFEVAQKCIENPDRVYQVEIDKPAQDGKTKTTLWDFIYLKASPDDQGEIQCVGIDITDRVHAEKEMRFQANLLDKIGQAVVAVDKEGKITYWNKAATTIYKWLPEEVIGRNIMEYVPSGTPALEALTVMKTLKNGETWSGEVWLKRKNGNEFPALLTGAPIFDDEQNCQGYIAVSSDNTERKKADVELRELNKNLRNYTRELVTANEGLEQFSFIVSHNLRSPVANIIGLGDLLKEESYPAEVREKFQQELLDNVKRLDNVVQDLNSILQVKVELSAKREPVLLEDLVAAIEAGIGNLMQEHTVKIITDFEMVPEIQTVQTYLHSIFYNLINNSIKYRHPERNPELYISSEAREGKIVIVFRDNGLGMDLTKKEDQVFGLYKRFHHHIEGKGMGLFMVKTQVELLGGKISVKSEVGRGSEFTIEFNENLSEDIKDGKTTALHSSGR